MDQKKLQDIQMKIGQDFVKVLSEELVRVGKRASGRLVNSLKPEIAQVGEQLRIVIEGEDYLTFVDQGRRKGKRPPVDRIAEWCSIRGIPRSAAWAISTNIYKFGIKPTHVIESAQRKFMMNEQPYLDTAFASVIDEEIKKMFNI